MKTYVYVNRNTVIYEVWGNNNEELQPIARITDVLENTSLDKLACIAKTGIEGVEPESGSGRLIAVIEEDRSIRVFLKKLTPYEMDVMRIPAEYRDANDLYINE